MERESFIGTWRLVSFEVRSVDGEVSYPHGEDAVGYIIYDANGYMSVAVMAAGRPAFASDDFSGGSTEEKAAAFDSYISYCGRYEVRGDRIIHHVEVSLLPNWIGGVQERILAFNGNRLSLSTEPLLFGGKQQSAHLIWERA